MPQHKYCVSTSTYNQYSIGDDVNEIRDDYYDIQGFHGVATIAVRMIVSIRTTPLRV